MQDGLIYNNKKNTCMLAMKLGLGTWDQIIFCAI